RSSFGGALRDGDGDSQTGCPPLFRAVAAGVGRGRRRFLDRLGAVGGFVGLGFERVGGGAGRVGGLGLERRGGVLDRILGTVELLGDVLLGPGRAGGEGGKSGEGEGKLHLEGLPWVRGINRRTFSEFRRSSEM